MVNTRKGDHMQTTIWVDEVCDPVSGDPVPFSPEIEVVVEYVQRVYEYGADLDGHRGATLTERDVIRSWLSNTAQCAALRLTGGLERAILKEAEAQFEASRP